MSPEPTERRLCAVRSETVTIQSKPLRSWRLRVKAILLVKISLVKSHAKGSTLDATKSIPLTSRSSNIAVCECHDGSHPVSVFNVIGLIGKHLGLGKSVPQTARNGSHQYGKACFDLIGVLRNELDHLFFFFKRYHQPTCLQGGMNKVIRLSAKTLTMMGQGPQLWHRGNQFGSIDFSAG